jgi:coproporphyrinogen III oxidase-like Fe-S oxidoreductase
LRLSSGIDATSSADAGIEAALAWAVGQGLVQRDADRLRLTARGRLLSNEVFVRLLPIAQRVAA